MKGEEEVNADLLMITMRIEEKYPELSKYIAKIPVSNSMGDLPAENIKVLKDYYESLVILLYHFSKNHNAVTN